MRFTTTLALALLAALAGAGTASAASIIVRPSATPMIQSPWTVSPVGQTADVALADDVVQPAAPSTTSGFLSAGTGDGGYAAVYVPNPSLPAGVSPTSVTIWVYGGVGTQQYLTPSLWTGQSLLGYTSWTAGPNGWRGYQVTPTPSAAQLQQLAIALRTDGKTSIGPAGTTKVYAAYLEVGIPDVAGPAGSPSAPQQGAAKDDPSKPDDTPGKDDDSGSSPVGPVSGANVDVPATVEMPATAKALPVEVSCPADQGGSCRGRVRIELIPATVKKAKGGKARGKSKARAARCARGCRVLGDTSFTVAAGKKRPVRVKLRPAAFKSLKRGTTVRARVTVTSRDQSGRLTTVTRAIAIHRARN